MVEIQGVDRVWTSIFYACGKLEGEHPAFSYSNVRKLLMGQQIMKNKLKKTWKFELLELQSCSYYVKQLVKNSKKIAFKSG